MFVADEKSGLNLSESSSIFTKIKVQNFDSQAKLCHFDQINQKLYSFNQTSLI
jgi:hypothetical protein